MDSRGILRTGWRKVGQKYYFFGQINGGAGYMRTSARINGIQIRKDGSASYNRTQLQKLNLMVRANQIVDGITNNRMTKPQKLRACFRYIVNYNYGDGGDFAGGQTGIFTMAAGCLAEEEVTASDLDVHLHTWLMQ